MAKTRSSTLLFTSKQLLVMDVHPHFSWLNQHFSMVFPPFPTINSTKIHHVSQKKLSGSHEIHHFFSVKYGSVTMFHPFPMVFLSFFHPTTHRARRTRATRARTPLPLFFPRANSPMNCDWSGQVSMAKPSWEWEHGGNMVGPQFSRPTTWLIQYD